MPPSIQLVIVQHCDQGSDGSIFGYLGELDLEDNDSPHYWKIPVVFSLVTRGPYERVAESCEYLRRCVKQIGLSVRILEAYDD